MAVETGAPPRNIPWADIEDDNTENSDFLLPEKQIFGPDENGIKKMVEYKLNDEGKVKITTTTRVRKLTDARLSKRAIERRSWSKFGDAVDEDAGSRLTMVSTEEILLDRPRAPGTKKEEVKVAGDPLASMGKTGGSIMVCRICSKKGDHWTAMCPYKGLTAPTESLTDNPPSSEDTASSAGPTKGSYVPPSMRAGAERTKTDVKRRNDENSVRVSNLSEDTREADLHELFCPFGPVSRIYVGTDQKTGSSRGFGFVNFLNREDAERAINKLNGYGYDSLILKVEWAAPRAN